MISPLTEQDIRLRGYEIKPQRAPLPLGEGLWERIYREQNLIN